MRIFSFSQPLNFMRLKWPAVVLSLLLVCLSVASFFTNGINWGLDFTGGTTIEVGFQQSVSLDKMHEALDQQNQQRRARIQMELELLSGELMARYRKLAAESQYGRASLLEARHRGG